MLNFPGVRWKTLLYSFLVVGFATLSSCLIAVDIPPAKESFRAQYIKDHVEGCIKAIEAKSDMRVFYSHKTVETYCTCRQRYEADVVSQAEKEDKRGVQDESNKYVGQKCQHILLDNLEHE